jgi:beta-fructofuranosidase
VTLRLPDHWLWDFWLAADGDDVHVFYLQAPRSLGDPVRRHANATIGHAVSRDMRTWRVLPDALGRGRAGAFDDRATWTGSVVRHAGKWLMFYSGISTADPDFVQRVGMAVSDDLTTWTRTALVIEADARWYEKAQGEGEEHWRDPWAHVTEDGVLHLLLTARSNRGPEGGRGVIGHAWSTDLRTWHVGPPLSAPGPFRQLEVPELVCIDGRWMLLFSASVHDHGPDRSSSPDFVREGGSSIAFAPGPLGPFEPKSGRLVVGDPRGSLYAGRLIERRGQWWYLAWLSRGPGGEFIGELSDPMPAGLDPAGCLVVDVPGGLLEERP